MKKEYEAPKAITYTEEEITEIIGPALTSLASPGPTACIPITKV